ncbi:MAG TPA: cysteine desulfurase family protein [Polyangiaceae bacterium]|nr:cysteine desulfurase family protein [Polyangiaceae bacterium]HNZ20891.1 cysteine desulfurase family protein [Polyangiaceae bacterium]HOD21464.1 cysteine desulfurase family protein [Polyangiaceae bacterium]HOE47572.1 cysteine desulfurase family protein [Polyangiaceae bacterium]HOG98761.1 cysteine desulfurase family protein [Polyangiaceae bacterium]
MNSIYLDWNATTPPLPEVVEAVAQASRQWWGNPSSSHGRGAMARQQVELARERVGQLVGRPAFDVIFTGGGTESNNLAIRGLLDRVGPVICSRMEHPSVLHVVEALQNERTVHWLDVDQRGVVDPEQVRETIVSSSKPCLVVIQWVNHETGVIQPVEEIVQQAHEHGSIVHVDAVQGIGKLQGRPWSEADTISLSSHKIRGPQGIGALVGASCQRLRPMMLGGPQERKLRPGTVPVALAVGFGVAASWASSSPSRYDAIRPLRDHLEREMIQMGAKRNGQGKRVPHVTNVSFEGVLGDELVAACDVEGVCLSAGSACASASSGATSAVAALLGPKRGLEAVRASLGELTTAQEIEKAVEVIRRVVGRASGDG